MIRVLKAYMQKGPYPFLPITPPREASSQRVIFHLFFVICEVVRLLCPLYDLRDFEV